MKITILADNLRRSLGVAIRAVSSRPQLPVLSGVLIKATNSGLELKSTDLELGLTLRVGAKVIEEGELVVPAKLLGELANGLSAGAVELSSAKNSLRVISGGANLEIVGQAADDFPTIPSTKGNGWKVSWHDFEEMVGRVTVSVARDDTRPILTGVLCQISGKGITMVATDGYRLGVDSMNKVEGTAEGAFVVPARAVLEWSKIGGETGVEKMTINWDKDNQQAVFSMGDVEMTTRLIAGEFPPYGQIIPSAFSTKVKFNRAELLEATKRASLFARSGTNVITLNVEEKKVIVEAESTQVGSSRTEVEADVEGVAVKMAFNARYLIEYLAVLSENEVIMETEGELKPGVFKMDSGNFLQLVMPVRV